MACDDIVYCILYSLVRVSLIVGDTNTTFTSEYVVCKEINVARMMIFHPENMSQSDIIQKINIKHKNTNIIYLTICLPLPIFGKNYK